MRVFVAGSIGVIGKVLVPQLVKKGHAVVALVRDDRKAQSIEAMGAKVALADALNKEDLTATVRRTKPEVIVHQLTAFARAGNFKKFEEEFVPTNASVPRSRTPCSRRRTSEVRRFIAQNFCGWPFAREGGPVKTEEDPLDPDPPGSFSKTLAAIRYLEDTVWRAADLQALALRYGIFYGPGTGIAKDGAIVELVRKRMMPIVGDGAGIWSFVHIRDAAHATVAAISSGGPGIYNVVDDEPAPVSIWLPVLADVVGAKPPYRMPAWLGKLVIGEGGLSMMTKIRGGSNDKTKREFGWKPIYQSWRSGFIEGLS